MLLISIILSLLLAIIWIDYFRRINVFEKRKLSIYIIAFVLGAFSTLFVEAFNWIVSYYKVLALDQQFTNNFLFSLINVGMIEELAKSIPFLLIFLLFRKHFKEPLDYLLVFCISALGFSVVENTMYFYSNFSETLIVRAALASVGHVFYSALIAYGVILAVFKHKKHRFILIAAFYLLAAASHGFYDFWLFFMGGDSSGWVVSLLFFMFLVSTFSTILHNAINQSSYFTYKIDSSGIRLGFILFSYFILIYIAHFFTVWHETSLYLAGKVMINILFEGIIIIVIIFRLSRFKLIKNYWYKLSLELLPRFFSKQNDVGELRLRGESSSESAMNMKIEEFFRIKPIKLRTGGLPESSMAYITEKNFTKNLEGIFKVKVYTDDELGEYSENYIFLKNRGLKLTNNKNQIYLLASFDKGEFEDFKFQKSDFSIIDWVVVEE